MNKYKVITMSTKNQETREHIVKAHTAQDAVFMVDFNHCQKGFHYEKEKRIQSEEVYRIECVENEKPKNMFKEGTLGDVFFREEYSP